MKFAICIQCRDSSTRLYHKSVRKFYKGRSILEIILYRLKKVKISNIFVLTTKNSSLTIKQAKKAKVKYFIGDENDVHYRFFRFLLVHNGFDGVIRICADNPFISLPLMYPIRSWASYGYDYVSFENAMNRHEGLFCEFISERAIIDMVNRNLTKEDKEHVTTYIRRHPELYLTKILPIPEEMEHIPIRLTVDTKSDFNITKKIYSNVGECYWMRIYEYIFNNEKIQKRMKKNIEENPK